jgi:hypothetical protein
MASAIEYKKNVISGAGGITRSTFRSFSSITTLGDLRAFPRLSAHLGPIVLRSPTL